jgi:hypothetical protein
MSLNNEELGISHSLDKNNPFNLHLQKASHKIPGKFGRPTYLAGLIEA